MTGLILLFIITFSVIVGASVISRNAKEHSKVRKDNSTFVPPQFIGDSHGKRDHDDSSDGYEDFGGGDGGGGSGGD
ncbi:hypothetical protein [Metabacillus niabensis]|uniref:hypothetical protein n=1 Tax=Metabacillus niabensis TaxID=324854 RepID=UPI001CFBE91F|nr:hypothetical protein [Metabacillus niabensis]